MGSQNLYRAQTGEAIPFGYNRKHPCPQTGWLALIHGHGTLITASLYGVCFGKGLTTYWTIPCPLQGQVVVPTKGSYWTRLGLQPTQVIQVSTNNITTSEINHHSSSLTMLCRAYSSQRGIRDKLVSTQDHDFPGFLPVCKRSSRGWSKSLVYPLLATNNSKSALVHETISIHKAITYSKSKGVVIVSKHHNKNIMPEFRNACLQEYAKDALYWKLSFFSKNPILQNTQIQIFQTQYQNLSQIFLK